MEENKNLLIVVSKVKQVMKEKNLSVSMEAIELISTKVLEMLDKAGEEAKKNKRRVIKARDIKKEGV